MWAVVRFPETLLYGLVLYIGRDVLAYKEWNVALEITAWLYHT